MNTEKEAWIQEAERHLNKWFGLSKTQEEAKNTREWAESLYVTCVEEEEVPSLKMTPEEAVLEEVSASQ